MIIGNDFWSNYFACHMNRVTRPAMHPHPANDALLHTYVYSGFWNGKLKKNPENPIWSFQMAGMEIWMLH